MAEPTIDQGSICLREGNFPAWKESVTTMLSSHRLAHCLDTTKSTVARYSNDQAQINAGLAIITTLINYRLLKRISDKDRSTVQSLMQAAQGMSGPFRFLDLPPELRNNVYDYLFFKGKGILVTAIASDRKRRYVPVRERSWAITQASRLIRRESTNIFYSRSHFALRRPRLLLEGPSVHQTAVAWVKKMGPEQTRSLRSVSIGLQVKGRRSRVVTNMTVMLTVSPITGLEIRIPRKLETEAQERLDAYVKKIESLRKITHLQGEAIILALTMDEHLWKYGELQLA